MFLNNKRRAQERFGGEVLMKGLHMDDFAICVRLRT